MGAGRRWALAAVVAGAGVLRVVYAVGIKGDGPLRGDSLNYVTQAAVLADGRGFVHPFFGGPSAEHPPLTVLLMTPFAWLGEGDQVPMRLGMALIGTAAVATIALLAARVGGARAALVAAALAAVYPHFWMNDGIVMAEAPTALLTAAVLLGALRLGAAPGWPVAAATGGLVGLAVLTRAELALLLPFVLAPALLSGSPPHASARLLSGSPPQASAQLLGERRRWSALLVAGGVAAAVVAPWAVWNLFRFEEPVLLSTNEGLTLLGANCDRSWEGAGIGLWHLDGDCIPPPEGDPSEVSATYRRLALRYVADRPARLPAVIAVRELRAWGFWAPRAMAEYDEGEDRPFAASIAGTAMHWVLLPLGLVGAVTLRRRGAAIAPFVGTFVVVAVTAALFYGRARFRLPADVALVVLAAAGIDHLLPVLAAETGPVGPVSAARTDGGAG